MAFERFYRLSAERRRAIVETAAEAFAAEGYERTSFNALLTKLGLSKSQAYYYFEDKADLFVTACAACYEEYYAEIATLTEPGSAEEFWPFVLELCRIGVRYQRSHPVAARLSRAIAESPLRSELGRSAMDRAVSTRERHEQWVKLGQKLGAVRTDLPFDLLVNLSIGVSAELDMWFAPRASESSDADLECVAVQFAELSRRIFSMEQATPRAAAPARRKKPPKKRVRP